MPSPSEKQGLLPPYSEMSFNVRPFMNYERKPKKELVNMTPAEIHAQYGDDVAHYIVQLRSSVDMWKRIRLGDAGVPQLYPVLKDIL